ncbi:hypothetical protein EMCRGX_G034966 [Ephydatia muelleri]
MDNGSTLVKSGHSQRVPQVQRFYIHAQDGLVHVTVFPLYDVWQYSRSSCSLLPLTVQDEMYILGKEVDALFTQVRGLVSCPSRILVEKPLCPLCEMSIQFQAFVAPHPLKAKGNGKAVVITPLLLYSDDLSGNLSKQWNLFDCWCILFAGLPRKMNHQLRKIHLLCASNTVSAVQMMGPIVSELCALEQGVEVFDEKTQECVLVVAPVLAIMCDNPRASQIIGHMTGRPSKFADANESSDMIAELRTKASSMVEFAKISFANGSAKAELKTLSGLCDMPTPILKLTLDPYQLTKKEKEQIQAFMNAFDYSGFEVIPKPKRICNCSGSLVGRDTKAFAQMALFTLEPYLSAGEKEVWIAMLKVFRIAYCGTLRTSMLDAYQGTCDAFVQAIKEHNPTLREFGPTSAYNTERCEAFNSLVRCQNIHSNRHNPSRDIAVGFSVREHLTYVVSGGRYGPNNEQWTHTHGGFGKLEVSGVLVTKPFQTWQKKSTKFANHEIISYHQCSFQLAEQLVHSVEHPETNLPALFSSRRADNIARNRGILKSVASAVLFCAKQCIALRGDGAAGYPRKPWQLPSSTEAIGGERSGTSPTLAISCYA